MTLHIRLRELLEARNLNLLGEEEYLLAKEALLKETTQPGWAEANATTVTPSPPPPPPPLPADTRGRGTPRDAAPPPQQSSLDAAEDVFPLPYPPKRGGLSRDELDYQHFYNAQMWEVFKMHPNLPLKEREGEVLRRWGVQTEALALRAEVNRVAHEMSRRRDVSSEETHTLIQRIDEARQQVQAEHDQAIMTVLPAVPAQLVGAEAYQIERKPHLFKFLRTAETATVDTALIALLASVLSLLTYLLRKAKTCFDAAAETQRSASAEGMSMPRGACTESGLSKPPQNLTLNAWKKFAKCAAKEFKETELRLVSEDTLQSLLSHFGRKLTQTEWHWVFAQWRLFQKGGKNGKKATPRKANPTPRKTKRKTDGQDASLNQRLLEQLVLIREGETQRDTRRAVEELLRREYDDVIKRTLDENIRLAQESKASEARTVASVAHTIQTECRTEMELQREELTATIKELMTSNATLKREMREREEEYGARVEAMANAIRADAKRDMNTAFESEFAEVREMRRTYEAQLHLMRSKVAICNEQSERLATELHSTFGPHQVEDLKQRLRHEVNMEKSEELTLLSTELRCKQELITSLTAQLTTEQLRNDSAAEAETLFKECLTEMQQSQKLSTHRETLLGRLESTFHRVQALNQPSTRSSLPLSVLEARYVVFFSVGHPFNFNLTFFTDSPAQHHWLRRCRHLRASLVTRSQKRTGRRMLRLLWTIWRHLCHICHSHARRKVSQCRWSVPVKVGVATTQRTQARCAPKPPTPSETLQNSPTQGRSFPHLGWGQKTELFFCPCLFTFFCTNSFLGGSAEARHADFNFLYLHPSLQPLDV